MKFSQWIPVEKLKDFLRMGWVQDRWPGDDECGPALALRASAAQGLGRRVLVCWPDDVELTAKDEEERKKGREEGAGGPLNDLPGDK